MKIMEQNDNRFMRRAVALAHQALGCTSPNPMVGAVIVDSNGNIVGEGYHHRAGEPHAEVNAINSVADPAILEECTIYVTLEPCCTYGRTPPCTLKIIESGIRRVVVGSVDPCQGVRGKGISQLREAGIDVVVGVEKELCDDLGKRFFTAHTLGRPYIILKWAQTSDGYLDAVRKEGTKAAWFTSAESKKMVHQWRVEEDAVMGGRVTAQMDNPALTVREVEGRNPVRILIGGGGSNALDDTLQLFDGKANTLVFSTNTLSYQNAQNIEISPACNFIKEVLEELLKRGILSVIVEGGRQLLDHFIEAELWDEMRIFTAPNPLSHYYPNATSGIKAPQIDAPKKEDCPHTAGRAQSPRAQNCELQGGDSLLLVRAPRRF